MKNTLKITALGFLCLILLGSIVFKAARADTTNTVLSSLITPTSTEDTTTLDQRLAARRAKAQITAAEKAAIAAKCSLAQTAASDRKTKDTKVASIRLQAYNELVKRLTFLVDNLNGQGNDATELLNAQNYFVASINNYLNDAQAYKVAMDDLVIMDCRTDPAGFKATLLEARNLRTKLGHDTVAIKANQGNLQKALANARQTLIKNAGKKAK